MGNQLSITAPFIGSPQSIMYQLLDRHSTQYTNYHKKNPFYCYLYLINNTMFSAWSNHSQTCVSSTFKQRIVIRMHMHTRGHQTMVTKTSKTTNLCSCFLYNMSLFWKAIPFIGVTFFCWQVPFRWVKETNDITILVG